MHCFQDSYPSGEGVYHTCAGTKVGDQCSFGCLDGWQCSGRVGVGDLTTALGGDNPAQISSWPPTATPPEK